MLGVAWVLEGVLQLLGPSSSGSSKRSKHTAGASDAKRTLSGKQQQHQQQQVQRIPEGWVEQLQAKQQEHKAKSESGGGKDASRGEQAQQGVGQQAALPAAGTAPTQPCQQSQQQPRGMDDASDKQKRSVPATSSKPKGGPVRQPTAVPVPTKKTRALPRDRQQQGEHGGGPEAAASQQRASKVPRGRAARDAASCDQGAEETCDDAAGDTGWHQFGQQRALRPTPRSPPVGTTGPPCAAAAGHSGDSASSQVTSNKATDAAASGSNPAPAQAKGAPSSAAQPLHQPGGCVSVASPAAAAPAQAPSQPPSVAPRPAPVPVNPRTVRPATLADIVGSRTRASQRQRATIAPASVTSPSSAPAPRPVVPIPIPVITDTPLGPAVPAAPARLSPGGPNAVPTALAAGVPSVPALASVLNPALVDYLVDSAPTVTTETVAGETAPATADRA